jgi:hypothetical protein
VRAVSETCPVARPLASRVCGDAPAPSRVSCLTGAAQSRSPPPGVPLTIPAGINNRGRIVGATTAGPGQPAHGFLLRDGAGGQFTAIDVPGAPTTSATGINDAGVIVGPYENPNAAPGPQPAGRQPLQTMPRALATR